MIEKIRVTLWDILTFFMSGIVFSFWALSYAMLTHSIRAGEIVEYVSKLPNSVTLFLGPVLFTALGLLLEPIANYFDRLVNVLWFRIFQTDKKLINEDRMLRKIIQSSYLGPLKEFTDDPYQICKDYVSAKSIDATFMVFLARFGFYRNIAFLAATSTIFLALYWPFSWRSIALIAVCLFLFGLFKKRAEDFKSYMSLSVFRSYLVDKALIDEGRAHRS